MKLIAIGASTSKNSINKALATHAASLVSGAEVEVLDLNDFALPIYNEDLEKEVGQPDAAKRFVEKIGAADGLIISFAEHNGTYTAAYKNLFDWASRVEQKVFQGKPVIFLSMSPGAGGAASVLKSAEGSVGFFGGDLKATMSVPNCYDNFDFEAGVMQNPELAKQLAKTMAYIG